MGRVTAVLAMFVTVAPLAAQPLPVQLIASQSIAEALMFAIPSLGLKGSVRATSGNRLHVVTVALGDTPIEADVRRFVLLTSGGHYEPIGAGGAADLIIPLDRLPLDREVGEILQSDAIVALTRRAGGVTLEASARATLALLYELPLTVSVRSLRLPDGGELATTP